jgi:uncharacterized membrane protein HdeD (DUF308 family)
VLSEIARNWWLVALRGVLAVVFGVTAFVWPGITFEALVLLFGAYALVDGVLLVGFGLMAASDNQQWWPLVLSGIIGISLGLFTLAQPSTVALALVYVVAFWAIFTGLLELVAAIRLRDVIRTEWLLGLSGVLSIIFGVLVAAQPGAGALTIVYLFGFYAVLAGIAQISLGYRMRGLGQSVQSRTQAATSTSR